ncbi:MAG: TrmH family RNA methyltransferase [Acidobacteriota bacterium]
MPPREIAAVLVRTHTPGNVGSAARVSKNFGVTDLRMVEPAALPDEDAVRLASGADDLLGSIRRFPDLSAAIADFDSVIATSSLRGREEQRSLTLAELPGFLADLGPDARTAFVFGPERSGLTEEERSKASVSLRLPSRAEFPTLNVSHALAAVLAVARMAEPEESPAAGAEPREWATARDVDGAVEHWDRALDAIGFYDTGHRERSLRAWRKIVAGRPLTAREAAILRGVANRVMVSLRRSRSEG